MTELAQKALLPAGLRDILPPDAAHEAAVVERLMQVCASRGFERVKPPLVEFEETLLGGSGAAMAGQTFRMMDPVSQRMLALRADMTLQVARIATTRLGDVARPLRLSYAGQVLRVKGSQLRPERQFGQVGVELIGASVAEADAEVALLAVEALRAVGIARLSVDLTMSTLVPAVMEEFGIAGPDAARLRLALDRKDAAEVAAFDGDVAVVVGALLAAAGPVERALERLEGVSLPPRAEAERARLAAVARLVREAAPELPLTLDPVENRGFEYHTGVGFTIFAPGVLGELGSGGRYLAGGEDGEPSTGFTLFTDTVLRALPEPSPQARLFLPLGTAPEHGRRLRAEGWVTVAGLSAAPDVMAEAVRMGCSHAWIQGAITAAEQGEA